MSKTYFNYDFYTTFSGHSLITADDKGIIVETALPFQKWVGKSIDEFEKNYRDRESFNGLHLLGKTVNGILQAQINSI